MSTIKVDFSKPYGKIKDYNAVNNAPVITMRWGGGNGEAWRAARFPYGRLHDTSFCSAYGGEWAVDVHRIFRNFDADENDPKNYIFAPTDKLLLQMFEHGTEPYFRLGASIEHVHKDGTYPPKDFMKWARICEHIIRHYTEGWADGFTHSIKYWEIWNEADNHNPSGNPCWQGTDEQFYDFFCQVCPYLQEKFPNLLIGGPAIATFHHTKWCEDFFTYMKERGVRPDFLSYHRYTKSVEDFVSYVRMANEMIERYGYGDIETHINEWNYVRGWRGDDFYHSMKSIKGLKGAAFAAGTMCALHPEKLDMLMYYEGRPGGWCGLFEGTFYETTKTYETFLAYDRLKMLGTAVESSSDDFVYSLGATNGRDSAVLLTYFDESDDCVAKTARLEIRAHELQAGEHLRVRYHKIDETHDLAECVGEALYTTGDFDLLLEMPPYTTYFIEILKEN